MRGKNRKPIANYLRLPQFTTMNVIDGQAGLVIYSSLICYSLTIDNILNIIVLLILVGVTISTLTGDNGLLSKANMAKEKNLSAEVDEEIILAWNKVYSDSHLNSNLNKANALKTELEKNGNGDATVTDKGNIFKINYRGYDKVLDISNLTVKDKSEDVAKAITEGTVYTENTTLTDEYGNKFKVPKGFKIASDSATSVTEGIVIEDATYENTLGSQFVWIPVGISKVSNTSEKILLQRYVFDSSNGNVNTTLTKSNPQDQLKITSNATIYYTEGLSDSTTANTHAKNIEDFITKTNAAGGFYIGRYEARTATQRNDSNKSSLTQITLKESDYVYNFVTQAQAAELASGMYETNNYFESDLLNSYAWDTTTLFLQEYDDRTGNNLSKYSIQHCIATDKICNVYNMASGVLEWTTETCSDTNNPCVRRGGTGYNYDLYTSSRVNTSTSNGYDSNTFRPILYIK